MARYRQPVNVKVTGLNKLIQDIEKLSHDKALKAARAGAVAAGKEAKRKMLLAMKSAFAGEGVLSTGTTIQYLDKKIHPMTRVRAGYMAIVGPATKLYGINLPDLKRASDPVKYKKRAKMRKKTMPTKVFHLYDKGTRVRNWTPGKGLMKGRKIPKPNRGAVAPQHIVAKVAKFMSYVVLAINERAFQKYMR